MDRSVSLVAAPPLAGRVVRPTTVRCWPASWGWQACPSAGSEATWTGCVRWGRAAGPRTMPAWTAVAAPLQCPRPLAADCRSRRRLLFPDPSPVVGSILVIDITPCPGRRRSPNCGPTRCSRSRAAIRPQ